VLQCYNESLGKGDDRMKISTMVLIGLLIFGLFYTLIIFKLDVGVMSYDKYYGINEQKTPCEFKQLDDGYTQLENCAKYKLDSNKLNQNRLWQSIP